MVDQMMPFGERRLFERKSCSRMVMINDLQDSYSGHMRDLAIGGALIEPPNGNDARIGQELVLTIPFGLKKDHIRIKARVAWVKPIGIGVRFIKSASDNQFFK
jgi:Tfp pilus assembly protein PilZ